MKTRIFLVILLGMTLRAPLGHALPEGGTVVGGEAAINLVASDQLDIHQTTDRALIHWNQFNIGQNESVRFVQPGSTAIALNRVVGLDPSSILGRLSADGRVFLINPNGILFGANAVVDVGGLMATTMTMDENDFMAGKSLLFTKESGASVINRGKINISDNGFVVLAAEGVKNEGLIMARLGKVVIGSSDRLTIDFMGDGLLQYAIEGSALSVLQGNLPASVHNTGEIVAEGGEVVLSARGSSAVFRQVVNQEGIIRANSLVNRGGVIQLIASDPVKNTGVLGREANLGQVKNPTGNVLHTGLLDLSGKEPGAASGSVTLAGAQVDVSGVINAQEGNVLIASTKQTVVTESGHITTSGINQGDAGNVVIWSDETTRFDGTVTARGGDFGGDAGFVEVSGFKHLDFTGQVDLAAPFGKFGTLLLDPDEMTVTQGNILKTGNTILQTTHKMTIGERLTIPTNASLTLQTQTGDIEFKSDSDLLSASGTGAIIINGGGKVTLGHLQAQDGEINITGKGDVTAKKIETNGRVTITSVSGSLIDSGSGGVFLTADTANLSAAKDISGEKGGDYDISVNHLILDIGGSFDIENKNENGTVRLLKTLHITSKTTGTPTYKLDGAGQGFKITNTNDHHLIENVAAGGLDFAFHGDKPILVGYISVEKAHLTSRTGSIKDGFVDKKGNITVDNEVDIVAGEITLSAPTGSVGIGGGKALEVDTANLTLDVGTNMNVASKNRSLDKLSITSTQSGDTNTYTLTAPDLVFDVTDAGTRYLITKVEDTRSPSPKLDFRFQGDEPIDVLGLKVGVFSASSKNNDISVKVPNDLVVGVIDAGTGKVTLSSGGMINDDQDDNLADIIANRVTLTAQTGIGVVNGNLDLSALQITPVTTQTGGINLQSLLPGASINKVTGPGPITLKGNGNTSIGGVETSDGNIALIVEGGTLKADTIKARGKGGVTLETRTSGNIVYRNVKGTNIGLYAAPGGTVTDLDHPVPTAPALPDEAFTSGVVPLERPFHLTPIRFLDEQDRLIEITRIPLSPAREVVSTPEPASEEVRPLEERLQTEQRLSAPRETIEIEEGLFEQTTSKTQVRPVVGETDERGVAKASPVSLEPAPDPLQRITQCLEGVAGCGETPDTIMLLEGVAFDTASDTLRPESQEILNAVAETLKRHPKIVVEIAGYSDNVGSIKYNTDLSRKRAIAVTDYLINRGVVAANLVPRGYGPESHVASNDTSEGRAKNRRVELHILGR